MSSTTPPPEPYNPPPATRADAAAQAGYPAAPGYQPPTASAQKPSNRLGLIAFVVALAAIVIGSILAFIGGMQSGALVQYASTGANGTTEIDASALPEAAQQAAAVAGLLAVAGFLVFGALGLWGFIQGIIAAIKNRGRGFGIAAIVLAVLGGIVVAVIFGIGATAGAAPYVNSIG